MTLSIHARQCGALRQVSHPQQRCFKSGQACGRIIGPSRRDLKSHAQGNFGTQIISSGFGGSNEIFVAGADGQLGARIVQKLLQAGYKVAAGVSNQEQAQTVVDFAASVELLKKQEVQKLRLAELSYTDSDSIESVLPQRARVLVVISDSTVKGAAKLDGKATSKILQAAQENDAQQFILVTPGGSATGGGNFFTALFGGNSSVGGTGRKPSKVEQEIASSGLDFVVIRTGKTEVPSSDFDEVSNVALGQQGSLPSKPLISKAQVAEVVQQILRQADSDVLIEAWASSEEPELSIEEAVAQALPAATVEEEEEEEEEESPAAAIQEVAEEADLPEEVKKPAKSLFGGFGTRKIKSTPSSQEEEEEDESPAPRPPKRRPSPPPRKSRPAASAVEEEDEGSSTQKSGGLFGFGGKKKEDDNEEVEAPTKTQRQRGFLGIGAKKASQEEDAVEESPSKIQRGFFGLGKKPQEEEQDEEEEESSSPLKSIFGSKKKDQAEPTPEGARKSAARGVKAVGQAAKKAPAAAARKAKNSAQDEEKPKKAGFLASIGLNSEKYVYEDDGDKY